MAGVVFDPFEALGVPRHATASAIKAQYHALARKYHPNRHHRLHNARGSPDRAPSTTGDRSWWRDDTESLSTDYFHNICQAWQLLSNADNRRRRAELLNLLELQDQMLAAFVDLLNADTPEEQTERQQRHDEHHEHSDQDGHISSDADEDLPNVGLQRRQTFANRNTHGAHLGDHADVPNVNSPTSPTKKHVRMLSKLSRCRLDQSKSEDYFAQRRKKLEKLRRKELEAFLDYRNAMVAKFEAEEEAERRKEHYEHAKWKREYFERAPRGTTERFRSFQQFLGAVTAFGTPSSPRPRNRSDGSYSTMTPIAGPGENGFLYPETGLSRQKTKHRRGWSSDISGDQSDSSDHDDSGEGNSWRRTPPLSAFRRQPRQSHETVPLLAFRAPPRITPATPPPTEAQEQSSGLKIIVRQPTNLGMIQEAQDSSGDTLSGSSRSTSPQPRTEASKFMWLPSSGPAEYFGLSSDRRARSISPAGQRRSQTVCAGEEVPKVVSEGLQFATKPIGRPHHLHIPVSNVYELQRNEKAWMLGTEPDNENNPEALLDRLQQLDPNVASKFMVKPDIMELFRFRLIYNHRHIASKDNQSFIALSYRRKLQVTKIQSHFTLPLEPEIFQAVWEERKSDHEGLWIDQICIDQDSREETTVSMSAMDMVYRSARLVVVALDDIELDAHEGELLHNHMNEYNNMTHVPPGQRFRRKQPPYLESHEDLFRIIRKILRSSWFKRAWCRHEMRLAKHHIFLVPCKRPGTWSGRDVLRFNGKCISHLLDLSTEVPFESDVESVKPALHAFFRDRSKMAPNERGMKLHHGNFSTVVAEVFAMEAGGDPRIPADQREADARKDKIAIILNTMECGLTISDQFRDPRIHLSQWQCYHDLMLLSLAAQDPGALCSVGAPLPITDNVHSWLYTPTVADSGLNNTRTLQRLPDKASIIVNTSGSEHYIQLDLKFLKSGRREQHPLDPDALSLARAFVKVAEERKFGRNRKRYLTHDRKANLLFGPMDEVYTETLACVFICGPHWVSDVCQRYSMSRWRVDLKGAFELLVALQNTCGRWPSHAWNERAGAFIMDFVNFLVIRGLPQRQILRPEKWRPIWVPTAPGGKVVTFVPAGNRHIRPAIPTTLMNSDYVHLARLWILEPRPCPSEDKDLNLIPNHEEWQLLGKSVIFSDDLSIEQLSSYDGFLKTEQKVFGRHRPLANGVYRERRL